MFLSVIMPAYNAEKYLALAVESVLAQTHADFELIVINDGSTDNTADIVREFEATDPRVIVISHDNWGMGRSLNHALEHARSEWVARIDADDIMEPHRLESQVRFVKEHPDIAVAASLITYIDERGSILGWSDSEFQTRESGARARAADRLVHVPHPTVLMRRSIVQRVGGYRPEFWPAEDLDLWNRIVDSGEEVLVQPEYLLRYRIHGSAASRILSKNERLLMGWLKQCCWNRNRGIPEPTWETFLEMRQEVGIAQRINETRKEVAFHWYQRATFYYCVNQNLRAAGAVLLSTLLDPVYAPAQVWRKLVYPRLFRSPVKESVAPANRPEEVR